MTTVKKSITELTIPEKRLQELTVTTDDQIDYSDIPKLDKTFWQNAELQMPKPKQGIYIKPDRDILNWMKGHGWGYQTCINAILITYNAHRKKEHEESPDGGVL